MDRENTGFNEYDTLCHRIMMNFWQSGKKWNVATQKCKNWNSVMRMCIQVLF